MTAMDREQASSTLLSSATLVPVLPLLYSAWIDGALGPEELEALERELVSLERLGAGERDAIATWLDPSHPPTAEQVASLGARVREMARGPGVSRPSDLGLELIGTLDPSTVAVLRRADAAAGSFTSEAVRQVVHPPVAPEVTLRPLPEPRPAPPGFETLGDLLDGPHAPTRRRVREVLSRPELEIRTGLDPEMHRRLVLDWTRTLAREGFGSLGFPARYGGEGDPGAFIAAFGEIARHDGSLLTKFGVQFGLFAGAVYRLGSERHHDELLPGALTLDLLGCFAMSETGHGSNVADLETTATFDPVTDEFVITTPHDLARKDYIGNAALHGRVAVVFAQLLTGDLEHGVHAFVVPIRTADGQPVPGVRIEDVGHKAGLNGVDNGRIWFSGVRIPRTAMLDRFASVDRDGHYTSAITSPSRRFFTTLGTLVGGRVAVATAAVSAAEVGLAIAVRYATRRRQFGRAPDGEVPLIEYPSHQRRLMPRVARTIGYRLATTDLARRYVESEQSADAGSTAHRRLEASAAGLKAYASWHAVGVLQECREACGGQGYLSENRIPGLRADADVFTTFEGDNTVLAQLVTKSLLTDYRTSFEQLGVFRIVEFLRSTVGVAVTESIPRLGSVGGDLDDPATQRQLMERREQHLIETLASRIRSRISEGMDPTDAFVSVQPHVILTARGHVERLVFDSMDHATEDGQVPVLGDVRTLATLSMVEADLDWYLQHGVVTAATAAAIRRRVTELSATMAADARRYVDAFRIPDTVLAAPIAR